MKAYAYIINNEDNPYNGMIVLSSKKDFSWKNSFDLEYLAQVGLVLFDDEGNEIPNK